MTSLNTISTITPGKKFSHPMNLRILQQQDTPTRQLYTKTQCTFLEATMVIIRMTSIDLISLQIPGFKLRNLLVSHLPPDIVHHAQLYTKACTYLEVTMGQNSSTTSTPSPSKPQSGSRSTSSALETPRLVTPTSSLATTSPSSSSAAARATQSLTSSSSAWMNSAGRMFYLTKESALPADSVTLE